MNASELGPVTWTKSSHSSADGQCVEWAYLGGGAVAVRDSKDPAGSALVFTRAEWSAFLAGVRDGEADL
ncbi:MAG TPA: DUF397 domain-containing protein [Pilimelia sp.]|nr:DUF397 domain-containing protein [Pilimelia sp.]